MNAEREHPSPSLLSWIPAWIRYVAPAKLYLSAKTLAEWREVAGAESWKNEEFVAGLKNLEELRCPRSSEMLFVVSPGELEAADVQEEIRRTLRFKNRVILLKSFVDPGDPLMEWGSDPIAKFSDGVYNFVTPSGFEELRLHAALERMRAGERYYLGFDTALANTNVDLRARLESLMARLSGVLPDGLKIEEAISHSFLYYGRAFQAPLHQALLADFSFQIANSKLWRFVHPRWTPAMRAFRQAGVPGTWLSAHKWIEKTGIPYQEVLVEPGDLLWFPENWWHEVHNVDEGYGLMCGIRPGITFPDFIIELPRLGPVMAWHKLSALFSLLFSKRDQSRPEFRPADSDQGTV